MRKLVAALACRIEGSRLFGKPLQRLDIAAGITILDQLIASLKKISCIQEIVLGIAQTPANSIFVHPAQKHKVDYTFGDEEDVLQRLIQCGEKAQATDIFRMTTESPFVYFEAIEKAWHRHLQEKNDATFADHVPDSSNFEIIALAALKKSHKEGENRHRSELCSLYIRENRQKFKVGVVAVPESLKRKDIRLTVDYPEDLILCRAVYQHFKEKKPLIPLQDIVAFLDSRPDLLQLISPFCEEGYSTMYK